MESGLKFSKELKMSFVLMTNGDLKFEDGVVYSSVEVLQLRRLKHVISEGAYGNWLGKIHKMKKVFETEVGLILPLSLN